MTKSPQIVDAYTDFSVGNLQNTSNDLDFALSKEGLFFVVKTPQGMKLTRDGSFTTNNEGKLVTKQGYEVMSDDYQASDGVISFNPQDSQIKADKNGQLYTNLPNSAQMTQNAKLFIAHPENLALLKKEGDGLFAYEDLQKLQSVEESNSLNQGFIEKSNVNAVKMMTQMIETNRLVGMYQKAMDTQMNDMNKDAIEKIARKV
jgi:flagellar basal-body rod protein FlgG